MASKRVGGLRLDPAVSEWQRTAATNAAALTKKQRKDRQRIRVKYDMPPALKERIVQAAKEEGTSASQLAAFLLTWAMDRWEDPDHPVGVELRELVDEAKFPSRSLRIEWNLDLDG
jgi:hypothetical protein